METTAGQIVNYQGDSAGALGTPGGASTVPIYGNTDATLISDAYRTVATHTFARKKAEYDKKVALRDSVYKDLESETLNLNKMLPNDRDKIRNEYLKPVRDFLIKKRGDVSDPDDWIEYQRLVTDFKEAKKYADGRLIFIGGMDGEIAKEVDPEKKNRMMNYRNNLYKQDMFAEVKPYQQALDWSRDIFATPGMMENKEEEIDGNNVITTTLARTPLDEFTKQTWYNYTDSPNKSLKNQMDAYKKAYDELPDQQKVDIHKQWNEKIKLANEDFGYKEGDLYYVKPIPPLVPVENEDGSKFLALNATTPEVVRAQAILDNYKNFRSQSSQLSKLPSEIRENDANADKLKLEGAYKKKEMELVLPAERALRYAQANQANSAAAKSKAEAQEIRKKLENNEAVGDFYINQMLQMFDSKKYEGLESGNKFGMSNTSRIISYKDKAGEVKSALSDIEMNSMGLRYNAGKDGISVFKPETVVYNFDDPKNPYFVATYRIPSSTPGGTEKVETKIWRPNQVLEGVIKGVVGETTSGTENQDYKTTMRRWRERTGKENINATVMSELEKDYWKGNATLQQQADDAFK